VLSSVDKEGGDSLFAKSFGGLQPVQTLNKYEARAVWPYLGLTPADPCRECWPRSRLLVSVRG
jgi:hypothetical protein